MIVAYRIHKSKYRGDNGDGARLYGGRWNQPGIAAIYAASHVSLAVLEILVHYNAENPEDYSLTEIGIPDSVKSEMFGGDPALQDPIASTSPGSDFLDDNSETQRFGTAWLSGRRFAVLSVPSAILPNWPSERNYVINPAHPAFPQIDFRPPKLFTLDPRLVE